MDCLKGMGFYFATLAGVLGFGYSELKKDGLNKDILVVCYHRIVKGTHHEMMHTYNMGSGFST